MQVEFLFKIGIECFTEFYYFGMYKYFKNHEAEVNLLNLLIFNNL